MNKPVIAYVGPAGSALGMQLAGVAVTEIEEEQELVNKLRQLKEAGETHIIFVDERLALPVREDIGRLNENVLPAIVLLPNPHEPLNLAQQEMNDLVVRAVGSDILSK
jgi:V/A-type H+/Na+-transporting ATPase subunit F